jgi:hypothetical protein
MKNIFFIDNAFNIEISLFRKNFKQKYFVKMKNRITFATTFKGGITQGILKSNVQISGV